MYPSGLHLVEQIVELKQRLIAYEKILGKVRVHLIAGEAHIALEAVRDVVVVYGVDGPVGYLPKGLDPIKKKCPGSHQNDGDDFCAYCGEDLQG